MIHYDEQNRITAIDTDTTAFRGHAVCNNCKIDMPFVWESICFYCRRTFCYDCVEVLNEKWVCKDCELAHENSLRETEGQTLTEMGS